ncbi:MAG: hypothetical protein ACI3XS_04605 [Eubacteriales bacterium]
MGEIITAITSSFSGIITGLTTAIKDGVTGLLFDTVGEQQVLSSFAKFGFTILGLGIAVGVVWTVVRLIRGH